MKFAITFACVTAFVTVFDFVVCLCIVVVCVVWALLSIPLSLYVSSLGQKLHVFMCFVVLRDLPHFSPLKLLQFIQCHVVVNCMSMHLRN